MENAIIYLLKSAAIVAVFYLAYYTFLRRETFFTGNRWFLLVGLITSFLLPLITYTHITWTDPVPVLQSHEIISDVVPSLPVVPAEEPINWVLVALLFYSAGVLYFLGRFVDDIFTLHKTLKKYNPIKKSGYRIIDNPGITSPFSFFRYIAYSSNNLTTEELTDIVNHEKVHSRELHSLDMILLQLCTAFTWFNPFIWLYKKAIYQNLEFIADAKSTDASSDKTSYQKTLLKITIQPQCIALTNHFYQSLIKKRIIMLNKNQSPQRHAIKYTFIVPVLCAFIYFFQVQVVAQQKTTTDKPGTTNKPLEYKTAYIEINKDLTDEALKQNESAFKEDFTADIVFSNISRNKKGEITRINVKVSDEKQNKEFNTENPLPIEPFYISIEIDKDGNNNIAIGKYKTIISAREIQMSYKGPDGNTIDKLDIYGQMSYVSDERGSGLRLSDNGNSGFVVNKQTTDMAFEHYKEKLKDINIELRYSEIRRDKKGYIQSIRMDVVDINNEHPFKISLLNYAKGNTGINDIYVGRRDGKIIAGELRN